MSDTDIATLQSQDFRPKSDFVRVMQERGYIPLFTDLEALYRQAAEGVITAYVG
jgi:tyrosyl-tRNA synthetase